VRVDIFYCLCELYGVGVVRLCFWLSMMGLLSWFGSIGVFSSSLVERSGGVS
jgi:hypothetical protein